MPRVDNPNAIANSLPGMLKRVKDITDDIKSASRDAVFSLVVGMGGAIFNGAAQFLGGIIGPVSVTGAVSATGAVSGSSVSASSTVTAGTDINAGGNVNASGTATIGGILTANAGMSSLDVRNTTVVTNRTAVWIDGTGRMGNSGSSVYVKQDFAPANVTAKVDALLHLGLLDFRRIDAVEALGDAAPVELGSIVEYVAGTALADMTFTDADGNPQGINWADIIPAMIATIQSQNARIVQLENGTVTA